MPCYHPITAYQAVTGGELTFALRGDQNTVVIPCGQCRGCRLKRSREWAARCMHEAQMHEHSCTITLTYSDEFLPEDLSLVYRHFQQFMKKLRQHQTRKKEGLLGMEKARFYMGGEYGEKYSRPHYHAALFGISFADKLYHQKTPAGSKIYTSKTLDKLWGKGYASIGELTFESAAYIARYIMKKRTGEGNKKYDEIINIETGEIHKRLKEFNQMSRKPGIGSTWLEKYKEDAYPQGKIVINTYEQNPPRYYDKKWAEQEPEQWEELRHERYKEGMKYLHERTPERLKIQEQVQEAKTKTLKRSLD